MTAKIGGLVFRLRIRDIAILITLILLTGSNSGIVRAEPETPAVAQRLFQINGSPFFMLGANYVGAPDRSWKMWQDGLFDGSLVERDILKAKQSGLNTLRIFVTPPLNRDILAGQWGKLDTVVNLAERHGIYLIITLYDYREDDLSKVAAVAKAVAQRYAGRNTILAYDLKNEPHYQELAYAIYPGSAPPVQTDRLIRQYGQRLSQSQAVSWWQSEGKTYLPNRFSNYDVYIYSNNNRFYQEFLADAGAWITARNWRVTVMDYIDSPDSARWRPLLAAFDESLAAWLKPQIEAIRSVDPTRPITVGYSEYVLAKLPANKNLTFVALHHFPDAGMRPLEVMFDILGDFQRSYPDKPVTFEEFGYSNDGLDQRQTSLYETAAVLQTIDTGMSGAAKWAMYDVAQGWNAHENNFGLMAVDGSLKLFGSALQILGNYVKTGPPRPGQLTVEPDGKHIRYVHSSTDAVFVGARDYTDPAGRLAFKSGEPTQVFMYSRGATSINLASTGSTNVTINPAAFLGVTNVGDVSLVRADAVGMPFERQGNTISFWAEAHEPYQLKMTYPDLDAKIEIVWPQGNKPVREADKVNIGAYLFAPGSKATLCVQPPPTVRLWRALNNGVEEEVAVGQAGTTRAGGFGFPIWNFNDVNVAAAREASNKYFFRLSLDGYGYRSTAWSHGEDARTYMPKPDVPIAVSTVTPAQVDAKIEIVWPQGNLLVTQATKANVATYLFEQGTLRSVPAGWSPTVTLWRAINDGYFEKVANGTKAMKTVGNLTFPAWEFNDVDVNHARDARNKYYFRITVEGVDSRSNVWSHGSDARTYFPQTDIPTSAGICQ